VKRVRLGKSELWATEVGFGGLPLQRLEAAEAVRVVHHALDMGINYIDTARGYTTSEEQIGRGIASRRDEVILASKSPKRDAVGIRAALETSLRTLNVECIDLYQLHAVSDEDAYRQVMGPGGALEGLVAAREAGWIREIGLTSHSMEMARQAAATGLFRSVMYPFNFVTTEVEDQLLPLCREHQTTLIAMKPMGGGIFERADLALGYLGRFPDVIKLVGIEKVAEIDEIVHLAESGFPLSPEAEEEMARLRQDLGTAFCRRCGYCLPCEQDIPIPEVLIFHAMWRRLPAQRALKNAREAMEKAEACIACEECVARCPYSLPIPELIQEQLALYQERLATHV